MENNTETEKHASSSIFIPVDVIEIILSRLPVKSLIRFKTVSKSLQAIISCPRFSRIHHHIQQSKNLFLLRSSGSSNFSLIKLENRKFRTKSVLEIPFGHATPLCSCDGMLLVGLKDGSTYVYVLWNPSIRKYASIDWPPRAHYFALNYGLYHDSRTDDYKVVIISMEDYAVYSCKNTSWAETKTLPFRGDEFYPSNGIFVDGSFYWCTQESYKGEVLCFDVRDEKLKKLPQPNDLKANETDKVRLIRLSGRMCLYHTNKDRTKLQLWVMEKLGDQNYSYSWRELMNMGKEEPYLYYSKPICLINRDNVVLQLQDTKKYVIYNYCEKSFDKLAKSWYNLHDILPYLESLYFPNQAEEEAGD